MVKLSPAGDLGLAALEVAVRSARQADGNDVGSELDGVFQFQNGQVVLEGALYVVAVDNHALHVLLNGRVRLR